LIHDGREVYSMIDHIRKLLPMKFNWDIEWNWNNTPSELQKDPEVRKQIQETFSISRVVAPPASYFTRSEKEERIDPRSMGIFPLENPNVSAPSTRSMPAREYEKTTPGQYAPLVSQAPQVPSLSPMWAPKYTLPPPVPTAVSGFGDLDLLASQVKMHMEAYHQAPEMSNLNNPKKQAKAHNYICSVTARHDLTLEQTMAIARKITAPPSGSLH
jgi:hypothetical protein